MTADSSGAESTVKISGDFILASDLDVNIRHIRRMGARQQSKARKPTSQFRLRLVGQDGVEYSGRDRVPSGAFITVSRVPLSTPAALTHLRGSPSSPSPSPSPSPPAAPRLTPSPPPETAPELLDLPPPPRYPCRHCQGPMRDAVALPCCYISFCRGCAEVVRDDSAQCFICEQPHSEELLANPRLSAVE